MLVTADALMKPAFAAGYAVGAFDVNNLELAAGVLDAAVEKRSPVILAIPEWGANAVLPMEALFAACARLIQEYPIPCALILDHGRSVEAVVRAIRAGATAVMLDASVKPYAENVALTRQAAEIAHWAGVSCEGEIGHVGQGAEYSSIDEDRKRLFTQPEQAIDFVRATGVDSLAVAVGTAHGHYVGTPRLDFELLGTLREEVGIPMVLHGGSSSGDENLSRAASLGVAKVNIYTDMATAARGRLKAILAEDPRKVHFGRVLVEAKLAFKEVAAHYMDVFGSTGRA